MPNTNTRPTWACIGVRDEGKGKRMCQTPETRPQGRVSGVRDEGEGRRCAGHQKHATLGVFLVSGTWRRRGRVFGGIGTDISRQTSKTRSGRRVFDVRRL